MSTPLTNVIDIFTTFRSKEADSLLDTVLISYCKLAVLQSSILISKDFTFTTTTSEDTPPIVTITINEDLTGKEIYLVGVMAYRNYLLDMHETVTTKAINFKTISFAITGLTERAKEVMRSIWWCDREIQAILQQLGVPIGALNEMRGSSYEPEQK